MTEPTDDTIHAVLTRLSSCPSIIATKQKKSSPHAICEALATHPSPEVAR